MASSSKFSVRAFVAGSQRLNQEKAEINAALGFLSSYFNTLKGRGPKENFEFEDERKNKLSFIVRKDPFGISTFLYEIIFTDGPGFEVLTIMSNHSRHPLAQSLQDHCVGPCRALLDLLWDRMNGHCDLALSQRLDVYYGAAARAAADDAERNQ